MLLTRGPIAFSEAAKVVHIKKKKQSRSRVSYVISARPMPLNISAFKIHHEKRGDLRKYQELLGYGLVIYDSL